MSKLVSILIPCYNHEKYLDSCIQSIIAQSYENIELLICDDCSQDASFEKLLSWKSLLKNRFSRVEISKNIVNQGVCKTLNGLVRKAKGEYIKILASDDMLQRNAIYEYVQFASDHTFDIVFSNALIISESDRYPLDEQIARKTFYTSIPQHGYHLTNKLASGNYIQGASLFIRKETFDRYGLYDEQYSYEDWEYLLRVSVSGNIEFINKTLVYYRVMEGTLSHYSNSETGRKKHRKFYEDKKRIFEKYNKECSAKDKSEFYNKCLRSAIVLNDVCLTDEIVKEITMLKLDVFMGNRIRMLALKMGAYNMLRTVKNHAKKIRKK